MHRAADGHLALEQSPQRLHDIAPPRNRSPSLRLILRSDFDACLVQPKEVTEGLQEIYDYWTEGFRNPDAVNEEALEDALYGAMQFGFNCIRSKLSTRYD